MEMIENYIKIEGGSEAYQAKIKQALDHTLSTSEGEEIIERAFELNDRHRITIDASDDNSVAWTHIQDGKIDIPEGNISDMRYITFDKEMVNFSLNRVLIHELTHMADPNRHAFFESDQERYKQFTAHFNSSHIILADILYRKNNNEDHKEFTAQEAVEYVKEQIALDPSVQESMNYLIQNNSSHENLAIETANNFMAKYFDVSPRVNYTETDHEGTAELEAYSPP